MPTFDGDLKDDDRDYAHDDETAGEIGGGLGVLDETHEDEEVEQENADGSDEAVLFAEGGEDEVGVGNGEEVALGLGALVGTFAPDRRRRRRL